MSLREGDTWAKTWSQCGHGIEGRLSGQRAQQRRSQEFRVHSQWGLDHCIRKNEKGRQSWGPENWESWLFGHLTVHSSRNRCSLFLEKSHIPMPLSKSKPVLGRKRNHFHNVNIYHSHQTQYWGSEMIEKKKLAREMAWQLREQETRV